VGLIGPTARQDDDLQPVTGAYHASEGSIVFEGQNLVGKPPHAINTLGISRTFQTIRLWNMMSVLDNVRWPPREDRLHTARDVPAAAALRAAERAITEESLDLLRLFGLDRYAEEPVKNLPYGASAGWKLFVHWPRSPGCCYSTSPPPV